MAEAALAAATVIAVAAVAASLPALMRAAPDRATRSRLTPSLVILTGGAVVAFAAYLAFRLRCGHGCDHARKGDGFAGLHRWWHRHDSWQWDAQLLISAGGLATAALALTLAARGRGRARLPVWIARLAFAAWALVVFAMPAVYELVTS